MGKVTIITEGRQGPPGPIGPTGPGGASDSQSVAVDSQSWSNNLASATPYQNLQQVLDALDQMSSFAAADIIHSVFMTTGDGVRANGGSINSGVSMTTGPGFDSVPSGSNLIIWNELGSPENGMYTYNGSAWLWSVDQPLTFSHFGDLVTAVFDFTYDNNFTANVYVVSTTNGLDFGLVPVSKGSLSKYDPDDFANWPEWNEGDLKNIADALDSLSARTSDALAVSYTPSDQTDWVDPDPLNVKNALDVLAGRSAADISYTPAIGQNWVDPDPSSAGSALDELSERLVTKIMAPGSATPMVDIQISNNDSIGYVSADTTNQDVVVSLPISNESDNRTIWFQNRNGNNNLIIEVDQSDLFFGGESQLVLAPTERVGVKAIDSAWIQLTTIA